ncbi:MAG: hypothetical protein GC154_06130 [bacterium]|nr:hypothetical protein [bacterium]
MSDEKKQVPSGLWAVALFAIAALAVGFMVFNTATSGQEKCRNELLGVFDSAVKQNPDVLTQLKENPEQTRETIKRIALNKPEIQTFFNSQGLWDHREEIFDDAWKQFVEQHAKSES